MEKVNVFLQGEGIANSEHIEIEVGTKVSKLKKEVCKKYQHLEEKKVAIFEENVEEPLDEEMVISAKADNNIFLHVHRCHKIEVTACFSGSTANRSFGPGAPISVIKKWAAIKEFNMTEEDAGEHDLQISGTTTCPDDDSHVGSLVEHPNCGISFDLIAKVRVQGSSGRE